MDKNRASSAKASPRPPPPSDTVLPLPQRRPRSATLETMADKLPAVESVASETSSAFLPPVLKCNRCHQNLRAYAPPSRDTSTAVDDDDDDEGDTFALRTAPAERSIHVAASTTSESYIFIPHTRPAAGGSRGGGVGGGSAGAPAAAAAMGAGAPKHVLPDRISSHLATLQKMYDVLHATPAAPTAPVCFDCAAKLRDQLRKHIKALEDDKRSYQDFLHRTPAQPAVAATAGSCAKELQALQSEEAKLVQELEELLAKSNKLQQQNLELQKESELLDQQEEQFWQQYHQFHHQLANFQSERHSLNAKYEAASKQTEKLKKTNVYNDIFRIWHEGPFGTINGFRLGRLANQTVEWTEINAGWGQAALLLDTLARKLEFQFTGYRLHPLGSFSKIEKEGIEYDLYGQGEFPLGRLFFHRKFDHGMVAFLQCLQQLGEHCEHLDDRFRLPYRIHKDSIGEMSIRWTQDEGWTRACKYMLTNLKWILAFVTKRNTVTRT